MAARTRGTSYVLEWPAVDMDGQGAKYNCGARCGTSSTDRRFISTRPVNIRALEQDTSRLHMSIGQRRRDGK